jgi:K+-transporting ATPase ATPase C chain
VTAIAQTLFPWQANGSLLRDGDRVLGSALIGQPFSDPRFVWGRPSATARMPYDAAASTGSNLGPTHPALLDGVRARLAALRAGDEAGERTAHRAAHAADTVGAREDGTASGAHEAWPVDLVTASGSGLDPHVSPAAALRQAARIARARGLPEALVRSRIEAAVEGRTLGVLGEPRVNVLRLNLALERDERGAPGPLAETSGS